MELRSTNITVSTPAPKPVDQVSKLEEWRIYKQEHGTDFIFDEAQRLMDLAGDDPEIKAGVYTQIVKMLFEFQREHQREFYLKALGKKFKPLKVWKQEYKALKDEMGEIAEDENSPGEEADITTLEKLGFYTESNKYWFSTQQGFVEGTNFVIEPLFHVYGMNNRRLIRVTNEYGYSLLCDVPSEAMVSADNFQKFLFSEGNFLIFINNNMFKKLLRHIGEKFPKCSEIKTFGWQPEGFWAFADGAFNGSWQPVDEMGIIEHDGKKYFSPAFSKVYSELRQDDDVYENDRRFIYRRTNIDITSWSKLMQKVYAYNNNGQYAVAFLASALFRSDIYNLYKIFPHLFLHGEKGSGKSQMAWSLSNVFQDGTPPFNLSAGTDVAFFRWLARYRDVVIWYDEYTDNIDEKRFQALKSAYDGVGREKGKMSRDSRTESDKIKSAAVISGQHLPQRDDNSLYTRSIVRFFVKPRDGYTREEAQIYDQLKRIEDAGLSQIITTLLNEREAVVSKYGRTFSEMFEYYKEKLMERGIQVDDRILRNYTILSTTVWIFDQFTKVDLSINAIRFRDMCLEDAIEQSDKVNSSDALGTFWKLLSGLIQSGELTRADYDVEEVYSEKTVSKQGGNNQLSEVVFEKPTLVLYLDFDRAYQRYMEAHRRIYGIAGLGLQTMMDYTHNHWSYIGLKSSHYFKGGNGKRTSAHLFNYTILTGRGIMADVVMATDPNVPLTMPPHVNNPTNKEVGQQAGLPF